MDEWDVMLVLLAQQGDRAALERLLEQIQIPLFRYLSALLPHDRAAAQDVLQETLFRIARKLQWLDNPLAFRAWTFRIASRELYRAARELRRTAELVPLDFDVAAAEAVRANMSWDELRALIGELPTASGAVVALHYGEDLGLTDIAGILEIPLGTVKSRLAYGLKRLRALVGRHDSR
jgi:RNA polymerase sigma-70 factor (ECF subfamily)